MSSVVIPETSLNRLRQAYANYQQLAVVISEAMGLGADVRARLDLESGVFVVEDEAPVEVLGRDNGLAQMVEP